jgi:hypothetical protein
VKDHGPGRLPLNAFNAECRVLPELGARDGHFNWIVAGLGR